MRAMWITMGIWLRYTLPYYAGRMFLPWRDAARHRARAAQAEVQLAGCSVAARGAVDGDQACHRGDYGWSPAYADVVRLRRRYDALVRGLTPAAREAHLDAIEREETFGGASAH